MKLETSQNTSRLNLVTDIWFGKTRNIDNIYQRWRQQNEQCPSRNVLLKENNILLDMLFLYERMFFCLKFCEKIFTSTICGHIFRFGTPPNAHGFSLRSYGFCWGVERAVAMAYEVGVEKKTWAAEGGLFVIFWGFSWDFPCFPKKYIAFLVGFLKKFEVWREHVGVQIDRFFQENVGIV